jgi:hypothetical protein
MSTARAEVLKAQANANSRPKLRIPRTSPLPKAPRPWKGWWHRQFAASSAPSSRHNRHCTLRCKVTMRNLRPSSRGVRTHSPHERGGKFRMTLGWTARPLMKAPFSTLKAHQVGHRSAGARRLRTRMCFARPCGPTRVIVSRAAKALNGLANQTGLYRARASRAPCGVIA